MAKFNLNQILNDASRAAAKGGEPTPRPAESRMEKISVYDLVPSEDNFYSIREIEELKAAIEIAGKVLQNLVVVPLDGGKYKVIAGHRRRLASISLVEEGKPQYEFVPCDVEPNEEAAEDQLTSGGGALLILLTLIQIAPIKVNPWTALAQAIGRAINKDVLTKLDETRKILDEHIKTDDARNADLHRSRILQFNNELLRDIPHTREDFIEILAEIDFYEKYCDTHPEYENNRATHAVANIKRVYDERLIKHDFL